MDIAEKAKAIEGLVKVYHDLGDENRIQEILDVAKNGGRPQVAEEPERIRERRSSRGKRGPYKMGGIYKGLTEGVATLETLVPRVEKHQYVPGKSLQDKCDWLDGQLKKSKSTYHRFDDGTWTLRKSYKNGNEPDDEEEK